MSTVHIESKNDDIANIVLMPGDPKRSEYIAKNFLNDYKLVNSVRGMTAYTGFYKGKKITIFPSGMGCPSMGIYSYELYNNYNVEYIIRIGSCGGYNECLNLGDVILVDKSISKSNYGNELDLYKADSVRSSVKLNNIIKDSFNNKDSKLHLGNIYCSDAFYEYDSDYKKRANDFNVLGCEMETFALFNNARHFNKNASALLTVSDLFFRDEKMTSLEREQGLNKMITLALDSCLNL